jgi:hypothetical protein
MNLKTISFDTNLNFKHKIITYIISNNNLLTIFVFNLYVKILFFLNIKNKSNFFYIKKISSHHFLINTEDGIINIPVLSRALYLSSGLNQRLDYLSKSYCVDYFKSIFEKNPPQ